MRHKAGLCCTCLSVDISDGFFLLDEILLNRIVDFIPRSLLFRVWCFITAEDASEIPAHALGARKYSMKTRTRHVKAHGKYRKKYNLVKELELAF